MGEQTGLVEEFMERDVCVTNYLDFVQSHLEPLHLNLPFLISSDAATSSLNGLLPAEQKVGESCSLQGALACGADAREILCTIHHTA